MSLHNISRISPSSFEIVLLSFYLASILGLIKIIFFAYPILLETLRSWATVNGTAAEIDG